MDRLCIRLGHPLTLDSAPGHGSSFAVRIPIRSRVEGRIPAPPALVDLAGRLIVVIEDDLSILAATRETLEAWGCDVVAAGGGAEALASLRARRRLPDAILADYGSWALEPR